MYSILYVDLSAAWQIILSDMSYFSDFLNKCLGFLLLLYLVTFHHCKRLLWWKTKAEKETVDILELSCGYKATGCTISISLHLEGNPSQIQTEYISYLLPKFLVKSAGKHDSADASWESVHYHHVSTQVNTLLWRVTGGQSCGDVYFSDCRKKWQWWIGEYACVSNGAPVSSFRRPLLMSSWGVRIRGRDEGSV